MRAAFSCERDIVADLTNPAALQEQHNLVIWWLQCIANLIISNIISKLHLSQGLKVYLYLAVHAVLLVIILSIRDPNIPCQRL